MKVLTKSGVEVLLKQNRIPYHVVTAYINGTDKLTSWTFEKEMKSNNPNYFMKPLENRLHSFFEARGIEIPLSCYSDEERRGHNPSNDGLSGKVISSVSPIMRQRFQEIGWKISFLQLWFGNSSGKFYNMLGRNNHIKPKDIHLLAYMGRCKETALTYGGGEGYYDDNEFESGTIIKSEWQLIPNFFAKFSDKEINKMLHKIGLPFYFYEEALEGKFFFPEEAICQMSVKWDTDFEKFACKIPATPKKESSDKVKLSLEALEINNAPTVKMEDLLEEPCQEESVKHKLSDEALEMLNNAPSFTMEELEQACQEESHASEIAELIHKNYAKFSVADLENLGKLCKNLARVKKTLSNF